MIETAIYEVLAGTGGSDSPNWHKEFTLRLMRNRPGQPMNPHCDATMRAGQALLQEATVQNVENHFGWTLTAQEFLKSLANGIGS